MLYLGCFRIFKWLVLVHHPSSICICAPPNHPAVVWWPVEAEVLTYDYKGWHLDGVSSGSCTILGVFHLLSFNFFQSFYRICIDNMTIWCIYIHIIMIYAHIYIVYTVQISSSLYVTMYMYIYILIYILVILVPERAKEKSRSVFFDTGRR